MTPEVRDRVRKLRGKLCSLAEEYKGVKPEMCQMCESQCGYGMELLEALGMEKPAEKTDRHSYVADLNGAEFAPKTRRGMRENGKADAQSE